MGHIPLSLIAWIVVLDVFFAPSLLRARLNNSTFVRAFARLLPSIHQCGNENQKSSSRSLVLAFLLLLLLRFAFVAHARVPFSPAFLCGAATSKPTGKKAYSLRFFLRFSFCVGIGWRAPLRKATFFSFLLLPSLFIHFIPILLHLYHFVISSILFILCLHSSFMHLSIPFAHTRLSHLLSPHSCLTPTCIV